MHYGVSTDGKLEEAQLDAILSLCRKLDGTSARIAAHIGADGIDLFDSPHGRECRVTALWTFRGDKVAISVVGEDWFHAFATLEDALCSIFKVEGADLPF